MNGIESYTVPSCPKMYSKMTTEAPRAVANDNTTLSTRYVGAMTLPRSSREDYPDGCDNDGREH